jgi:hypothetical protein
MAAAASARPAVIREIDMVCSSGDATNLVAKRRPDRQG